MSIDILEIHKATGKLLQFIEAEKIDRNVATAALHSAAETLQQASYADQRLLMLAQYFKPPQP